MITMTMNELSYNYLNDLLTPDSKIIDKYLNWILMLSFDFVSKKKLIT